METDNDPPDKEPPPAPPNTNKKPPTTHDNLPTHHTTANSINYYNNRLIDNSINFAKHTPTNPPLCQPDPMTLLATALSQDTDLNLNSMDIHSIKAVLALSLIHI